MPRKVILGFGISLDGYIARRNGDLDFLVIDKEGESVMAGLCFAKKIDTTIMGRKTALWLGEKMRQQRGEMPETPGMANYVVFPPMEAGQTARDFEVVNGSLTAFVGES